MDQQASDSAAPESPATITNQDTLWYKDAVIYQLHVKAFFDSNGDGVGDFRGLAEKLDYVQQLGVNTIWLLPFYPSPLKDDGYDVADYRNVNAQYGTNGEFRQFVREAHRRDLRVITELVMNHTSDQHPWFQAARRAPAGSPKRNYYVWSDSDKKYSGTRIIFTDTEASNWSWDPLAKAYYWHRFFSHQPDLNFDNPHVLKAMVRVMHHWLDMGVDGFRLDAIPYLIEREGTNNENLRETHAVIRAVRAALDKRYPGKLLLAEANQWPEDVREYFGDGDECHMAYHFPLMPRMYMAIAQEDRYPVAEILRQTPEIPSACQWAIFLRNHDELTLEMVTSKERDYMYRMYAAEPRARINLGIRRRLAPLLENDMDRLKLMNSLLLSMPGSPIIYYGDEIGMGDNIYLGDRNGVRTPMQWSPDRNAGFSRADPQRLYLPPIMDAVYGYEAVNVEAQSREPNSLLNWMRRLLAVRKTSHAFGRGRLTLLRPGNRKVLAYLREYEADAILCVANLGRSAQPVELDLARFRGRVPVELLGRTAFPPVGELPYLLTLPACGFYWLRLATPDEVEAPHWHEERLMREDLPVVVLFDGWMSFFRDQVVSWRVGLAVRSREQLESDVLPRHIAAQRWYARKGEPVKCARLADWALWNAGGTNAMIAMISVESETATAMYFMPLVLAWEDTDEVRLRDLGSATLAKVRQQARIGVIADALADEMFCRAVVSAIGANQVIPMAQGKLHFTQTSAFADLAGDDYDTLPLRRQAGQSSNTVVILGDRLFFKGYRRLQEGTNPELEVGRFLTQVAKFTHCVPMVGAIEYVALNGAKMTLGLLQAYRTHQGDGWNYTIEYLRRFLEQQLVATDDAAADDIHGGYLALMQVLGQRSGELHCAFARRHGEAAFDPEPVTAGDIASWKRQVEEDIAGTCDMLVRHCEQLEAATREIAQMLLARRQSLSARVEACASQWTGPALKTRYHGDYHLGQVLLAENDFLIIDFEGEPARPIAERGRKHSSLRDVASMLRSFDYARWAAIRSGAQQETQRPRITALAGVWQDKTRSAFLAAYRDATKNSGLYASFDEALQLVALFEIEKALYEIRYELDNRPTWVDVPLRGLLALTVEPVS